MKIIENINWSNTVVKFVTDTSDSCGDKTFVVKGRVRWQAALFDGMQEARAKAWEKKARKQDRERVKEMAGEWILRQPPWWTHFQRPTWQIAMRLRYGLEITPAIGRNLSRRCLAKKLDGSYCMELLDAQVCQVEGAVIHRHDTARDGLQPELKRHATSLKTEQFVYELAELDNDTGMVSEARMDLIAEMLELRAMLDVRVFQSTAKVWKSTRSNKWRSTDTM